MAHKMEPKEIAIEMGLGYRNMSYYKQNYDKFDDIREVEEPKIEEPKRASFFDPIACRDGIPLLSCQHLQQMMEIL